MSDNLEALLAASIYQAERKKMATANGVNGAAALTATATLPAVNGHQRTFITGNDNTPTVPPDLVRALYAPLPPEAIQPHPTKDYLSSVKAIFVIERLNEVFGMGGWTYRVQLVEANPDSLMVVVRVILRVPAYGIRLEQFGGSDNKDRGDAYKGATTDALSKCASYLGVAIDVYKGGGATKRNPRGTAVTQPRMAQPIDTTAEASQYVAEQKIAELKSSGQIRRAFAEIREPLGETDYLEVMAKYGVTSPEKFKTTAEAREAFKEMLAKLRKAAS